MLTDIGFDRGFVFLMEGFLSLFIPMNYVYIKSWVTTFYHGCLEILKK